MTVSIWASTAWDMPGMPMKARILYVREFLHWLSIRSIPSGCLPTNHRETDADEDDGEIRLRFTSPAGHDAGLLMQSLVLGLQGIQNTYGNDYIILNFREV